MDGARGPRSIGSTTWGDRARFPSTVLLLGLVVIPVEVSGTTATASVTAAFRGGICPVCNACIAPKADPDTGTLGTDTGRCRRWRRGGGEEEEGRSTGEEEEGRSTGTTGGDGCNTGGDMMGTAEEL